MHKIQHKIISFYSHKYNQNVRVRHVINKSSGKHSTDIPKLNPCIAIKALLTMMIPTDVVTLKLHAAKSSTAFLSDFFRELMSDFMVSAQHFAELQSRRDRCHQI